MQNLTNQGLVKARDMISQVFADPNSLDDIGVLSFQLEKQLQAADNQLNGAVQSKLDSLKRAVNLMDESAVKLDKLSSNINRIDEKIAQTNTAISKYDYLKRVHNVRDNLSKVIAQVEFFAKVPERAKELRALLDKKPASLKEVYLESLKYDSLRVALTKEISVSRSNNSKRKSTSGRHSPVTGGGVTSSSNTGGDYGEIQKIRAAVETHLQTVPELVQDVRQRVFGNIERMWDLAANSPQDLVASFEIVEMQHEYNERRNKALLAAAASAGTAHQLSPSDMHEDIVGAVEAAITRMMSERVEGEFEALNAYTDQGDSLGPVTALIMSANQVLQKMIIFREEVVPCVPPAYQPMLTFVNSFELVLLPRVETVMRGLEELKVGELLDLINWIEYHKACMEEFGFAERPSIDSFASTKTELMIEYKTKIKAQVAQWFDNIRNQPLEIRKGSDDTLVTSHPEDMFNIIHAQVEVAREKLPLEYSKEVAIACLQVLQSSQRQSYDALSSLWHSMDPEAMCATINDNQRMQEKCDEFGEYLCRFVEEGPDKEILTAILEEVSSEYIALAVKAVNFLAKCILGDLEEEVFGRLYTHEWEAGADCISTLTATLSDYFQDLSHWLSEYFYSKFVKETLVAAVDAYVMSLRRRANGAFTFSSEILVANRVIHDKTSIEAFFEQYADILRRGGLKKGRRGAKGAVAAASAASASAANDSPLTGELEPLINLARVVSSRNPFSKDTEGHVRALFERWGVDGLRVVQAAILCYPSGSSTAEKESKRNNVEIARKLFESNAASSHYSTEPLPDFANFDAFAGLLGLSGGQAGAISSSANSSSSREPGKGFLRGWGRRKQ